MHVANIATIARLGFFAAYISALFFLSFASFRFCRLKVLVTLELDQMGPHTVCKQLGCALLRQTMAVLALR